MRQWRIVRPRSLRKRIEGAIVAAAPGDPDAAVGVATLSLTVLSPVGWSKAHTAAVRTSSRKFESMLLGGGGGGGGGGAAADDDTGDAGDGGATGGETMRDGRGDVTLVWEAYAGWLESLLRNPYTPRRLAARLRRQAVKVSSRAHAAKSAAPPTYLRWAVLRLLGPGGSRALLDAPPLEHAALDPAVLSSLLAAAAAAADDDVVEEADGDGGEAGGGSGGSPEGRDAALQILSISLKRCPPKRLLRLLHARNPRRAEEPAEASTTLAAAIGAPESAEAPGPLLAPLLPLIGLELQLTHARAITPTTPPPKPVKARARAAPEAPPTDALLALAPLGEAALTAAAAAAAAAQTATRAGRKAADASTGKRTPLRTAAAVLVMRPTEGAEAAAVVWSVWLRLGLATAEASRAPRSILTLLRRATESLPQRAAHLQTIVATWLAEALPAASVRQLTPAIIAMPATPLAAYEALLAALAAPPASTGALVPASALPSSILPSEHRRETRQLFDAALAEHGAFAVNLWLAYSRWHTQRGEFADASGVHARALKALAPELHQDFVQAAIDATNTMA